MAVRLKGLRAKSSDLSFDKTSAVTLESSKIFILEIKRGNVNIIVKNACAFKVYVYKNKVGKEIPLLRNERLPLESADRIRLCNGKGRSAVFLVWTLPTTLKKMIGSCQNHVREKNTYMRR